MQKVDTEGHQVSMPSTPVTTPGAPLFRAFEAEVPKKKSLLSRGSNCFSVDTWPNEEGGLPAVTCSITMPPPPVPLAKKVISLLHLTFGQNL